MRLIFRIENDISYDFIYWSEVSLQYYRFSQIKLQDRQYPRAVNFPDLARNLCNYLGEKL